MRTSGSTGERSEPERRLQGGGPQGERKARVILVRQPLKQPAARRVLFLRIGVKAPFDRPVMRRSLVGGGFRSVGAAISVCSAWPMHSRGPVCPNVDVGVLDNHQ